jgi:hypothetical protein
LWSLFLFYKFFCIRAAFRLTACQINCILSDRPVFRVTTSQTELLFCILFILAARCVQNPSSPQHQIYVFITFLFTSGITFIFFLNLHPRQQTRPGEERWREIQIKSARTSKNK